jgi:Tfp pilus assembly pilus retraction ATPase PilT
LVAALQKERALTKPAELLSTVSFFGLESCATDIYLRKGMPAIFRVGGYLYTLPTEWKVTDEHGCIPNQLFDALLDYMRTNDLPVEQQFPVGTPFTRVYRIGDTQIRAQYTPGFNPQEIMLRIQPIKPFPLASYFDGGLNHPTVKAIEQARGLIVVCGPIGGGKTTLQQSIIEHWATCATAGTKRLGRHIAQLADPIEYQLTNPATVITSCECALTTTARRKGIPSIEDVIPHILRTDVDALAVGEIREAIALDACLLFSGASEPVITTMHGASIAECIVRMITMAEKTMSSETAKLILSSCLEGILYVNLAFIDSKRPVPVIEYLPIRGSTIPTAITNQNAIGLADKVKNELMTGLSKVPGALGRPAAIEQARKLHKLTDYQATQALGRLGS